MYQYQPRNSRTIGMALGDCLHNIFGSGLLLISAIILLMASLISIVACLLPFWFKLTLYNQIFGEEVQANNIEIDTGLYFMYKDKFINLLMIDKASSVKLMPMYLRLGQLFFLIGTIGIITCTACAILLAMRSKIVVSAEMALAGASLALAVCQVVGVVFSLLQVLIDNQAKWQDLPVKDAIPNRFGYYKILEAYPVVEINWGFYFGAIAAICSLGGAVMCCIKMFMSCTQINHMRYQMLRTKPDEGSSPIPGYPYYANKGYDRSPGIVLPPGAAEVRPLMYAGYASNMPPSAREVDL